VSLWLPLFDAQTLRAHDLTDRRYAPWVAHTHAYSSLCVLSLLPSLAPAHPHLRQYSLPTPLTMSGEDRGPSGPPFTTPLGKLPDGNSLVQMIFKQKTDAAEKEGSPLTSEMAQLLLLQSQQDALAMARRQQCCVCGLPYDPIHHTPILCTTPDSARRKGYPLKGEVEYSVSGNKPSNSSTCPSLSPPRAPRLRRATQTGWVPHPASLSRGDVGCGPTATPRVRGRSRRYGTW